MPIGPGSRLGPYSITAAIGAGGMGEVYKGSGDQIAPLQIIVVQNWLAELRRLVPTN